MPEINGADTAWILASTAMVVVMTFGLAVFYGGMIRAKNVLNTMMMVVATIAILTVVWFGWGYSMAFSEDVGGGLVGGFDDAFMTNTMKMHQELNFARSTIDPATSAHVINAKVSWKVANSGLGTVP